MELYYGCYFLVIQKFMIFVVILYHVFGCVMVDDLVLWWMILWQVIFQNGHLLRVQYNDITNLVN